MEDNCVENVWINIIMNEKDTNKQIIERTDVPSSKPNEKAGISVQGHLKIFDPSSKEVFINKRTQ